MREIEWPDTMLHRYASVGHVTNAYTQMMPDGGEPFCDTCGQKTITACAECQQEIRGPYRGTIYADFPPPNFCRNCGKPYPWTEQKLLAVKELIEREQRLSATEKAALEADIDDITRDVPRTQAAAIRVKGFLAKIPGALGSALRDIVVDVASEAAKRTISGP